MEIGDTRNEINLKIYDSLDLVNIVYKDRIEKLYIISDDIVNINLQELFNNCIKININYLELDCSNLSELVLFDNYTLDTVSIYNAHNINDIIGKCNNLSISYCKNVNFKTEFFSFINSLHINSYEDIIDISHMERLKDLTISIKGDIKGRNSSLEKLNLEFLDIEDVNFIDNFPNVKSIVLDSCSNLKRINKLYYLNLENVEITKCEKLKDDEFYNITNTILKVSIRYCPLFKDVYKFKNKKELDFTGCTNIKNLSCLESNSSLYYLNLSYTPIRHVFSFKHIYHLVLRGCKRIKSTKGLEDVKILDLYDCCGIEDFSGLKNNLHVNLLNTNFCKDNNNFKYIQNAEKIEIEVNLNNSILLPNHECKTDNNIYIKKNNK